MVRLIDADALVNKVETARKKAKTLTGMDFVMVTKDAPPIDAIPVEWLRKKREVAIWQFAGAIDWMLSEWRKEQEAR